jgi:hypothetical protein
MPVVPSSQALRNEHATALISWDLQSAAVVH